MSEKEEQQLHDMVRKAMNQLQPVYDEAHWQDMQQRLAKSPPKPFNTWLWSSCIEFIFVISAVIWFVTKNTSNPNQLVQKTAIPKKVAPVSSFSTDKNTSKRVIPEDPKGVSHTPEHILTKAKTNTTKIAFTQVYQVNTLSGLGMISHPVVYPFINLNAAVENDIRRRTKHRIIGPDSVTSEVMDRNKNRWRNVAIVCDFTSSMYPYATELFTWFDNNRRNRYIKGAVFFTDCDSLGNETVINQSKGKMFVIKDWEEENVVSVFIEASRNTIRNVRLAENDLEAILYAQKIFPGTESFVLIADNSSPVKDMHLLSQIKKPVHIIVCGITYDQTIGIQPDFLKIATQTHGSLHTLTSDLPDVANMKSGTRVTIGNKSYKYKKGNFVLRKGHAFWKLK